jgi:hypothetical protein
MEYYVHVLKLGGLLRIVDKIRRHLLFLISLHSHKKRDYIDFVSQRWSLKFLYWLPKLTRLPPPSRNVSDWKRFPSISSYVA